MSLFNLAKNAKESQHESLAKAWITAATAKLDDISAWRAYAAAKEEESKLLNYSHDQRYWRLEKHSLFIHDKEFDKKILLVQKFQEKEEKEKEFKMYLKLRTDKSFHHLIGSFSFFSGNSFLTIWCDVKANNNLHTSFLWKFTSSQSVGLRKKIMILALSFEDTAKELASKVSSYGLKSKCDCLNGDRWKRIAKWLEDAMIKLHSLLNKSKELSDMSEAESEKMTETLQSSIRSLNDTFVGNSQFFDLYMKKVIEYDLIAAEVIGLLPVLIQQKQYSFPKTMKMLRTKCDNSRSLIEESIKNLEEKIQNQMESPQYAGLFILHLQPLVRETETRSSILKNYRRFLTTLTEMIQRTLPCYASIEDKTYLKIIRAYIDSFHNVFANNRDIVMIETVQFFQELISFSFEASKKNTNAILYSRLADISFEILDARNQGGGKGRRIKNLGEARNFITETLKTTSDDSTSRSAMLELSDDYREIARYLNKLNRIKGKRGKNKAKGKTGKEELIQLYSKTVLLMENAINAKRKTSKKIETSLYRQKADKYLEAIAAYERGDLDLAKSYENEAREMKDIRCK